MLMSAIEKCHVTEGATVEGAGIPEVNGFYKRVGTYQGAQRYEKSAMYEEENIEFSLYQCNLTSYISIVPDGFDLGGDREIDFYYSEGTEDETTPPRDGWLDDVERGQLPAPKVHV